MIGANYNVPKNESNVDSLVIGLTQIYMQAYASRSLNVEFMDKNAVQHLDGMTLLDKYIFEQQDDLNHIAYMYLFFLIL